jgi:hypothetical protein
MHTFALVPKLKQQHFTPPFNKIRATLAAHAEEHKAALGGGDAGILAAMRARHHGAAGAGNNSSSASTADVSARLAAAVDQFKALASGRVLPEAWHKEAERFAERERERRDENLGRD